MRSVITVLSAGVALVISGCRRDSSPGFLGSAIVESRTYKVATTVQGPVKTVLKREGQQVAAGDLVAVVDTTPLVLKLRELAARTAELNQVIASKRSEISSLEEEIRGLAREYGRIGELADKGSVPMQQKDDLGTKMKAADFRLQAARQMLASLGQKRKALDAQVDQIRDQIDRCRLAAPAAGVVVSRFKNPGEVLGPGMPVLEIGELDTMYVDFFVPQVMLSRLTYGTAVKIRVDTPEHNGGASATTVPATVVWVSDEAEFSPKNIQTRESRNELVFRIRATAANDRGLLKRGMPVEVWREQSGSSDQRVGT
jgi:HlyD family secretion protein